MAPERRARPSRRAPGIRWDRVSRIALLVVLVGMLGLYVGPARSYWSTRQEAAQRRSELAALQRAHARLKARRDALRQSSAIQREARRLGMVKPGERPYVVTGLPGGP